jgi:AcrR family transcriptional regulator
MPSNKKSSIRRQPIQARSRERRQRIIDAASDLLREYDFNEITMNAIAAKARIPTPAIYNYFSDKEAILTVIVSDLVSINRSVWDQVEKYFLKVDWRTFWNHLEDAFEAQPIPRDSPELRYAIHSSSEARKIAEKHRVEVAELLVRFLQGYGSKWPRKQLLELSHIIIDVYDAIDMRMATQPPGYVRLMDSWRRKVMETLVEQGLPEA